MLYEYKCDECGREVEVLQKVNDPAPKCCKGPMRKLMSRNSFILKGTGWYKTDYGPKRKKKKGGTKNV